MKNNTQSGMFWVLATLVVASFPQLLSMPAQLVPLVVLPVIWRFLAELRGWKPAPILVRVAATIMFVFILIATYGGILGRRAAVGLLTLMLALKLLETFKVRDARVVASLCLFLCATQFLFSQGIFMLIYGGLVLVGALVAMVLLQRREAFMPRGIAPPSGHSIFSELGYSTKLLAIAIPVALAIFVLFPRWGSPLWGVPESSLDAKSGLSESMSPGSIQNLFMDDSPAFRADFQGLVPAPSELYWRGPVFWEFDGRQWLSSFYSRNLPATERAPITPGSWRYTVQMEPSEQRWIFALDYPAVRPGGVRMTMDYQLYASRPITQLKSYTMVSNPNFTDSATLKHVLRAAALELPQDFNPRTLELVREWRSETASDQEFISRVLDHFNREEFHYTLNPPGLSRHTVDEFLFDTRSGFCEHYASSFTVMMRMAGIPARVVTGYQGGWFNDLGRYVLVRQSDAHAWSEVWLEDSGWTRVDPTAAVAPGRVERGSLGALGERRYMFDYQWLRNLKNGFDLLQRNWNRWVIAFGADSQAGMFRQFGFEFMDSKRLVALMLIVVGLILLIMLPFVLRLKVSSGVDPAAKLWKLFRDKLDKAGVNSSAAMTPAELYLAASNELPGESEKIGHISTLYNDIRYSRQGPEVSVLESAVKGFRPSRKAGKSA